MTTEMATGRHPKAISCLEFAVWNECLLLVPYSYFCGCMGLADDPFERTFRRLSLPSWWAILSLLKTQEADSESLHSPNFVLSLSSLRRPWSCCSCQQWPCWPCAPCSTTRTGTWNTVWPSSFILHTWLWAKVSELLERWVSQIRTRAALCLGQHSVSCRLVKISCIIYEFILYATVLSRNARIYLQTDTIMLQCLQEYCQKKSLCDRSWVCFCFIRERKKRTFTNTRLPFVFFFPSPLIYSLALHIYLWQYITLKKKKRERTFTKHLQKSI